MRLPWQLGSSDQSESALLHDALELRKRYGFQAEAYCDEAIQSFATDEKRCSLFRGLRRALGHIPSAYVPY